MKTNRYHFQYGKFEFEINFWDQEFYRAHSIEPTEAAEGALEIGWCAKPGSVEMLYIFPIIKGQIDWQAFPTHAALIPDGVQEHTNQLLASQEDKVSEKIDAAP